MTGDPFHPTHDHLISSRGQLQVIGDREKVARDHVNLIFRTVNPIERRKESRVSAVQNAEDGQLQLQEDDCEKSWPDKLKDWWKEFADPNKPPWPPLIPIPPKLPTPHPVIPELPPFYTNPCMLNPSLCDDGTGIA